jgi:exonuclease III
MSAKNCNLLWWNVRGLNDGAKRASVRNQIIATGATIVCFQETKISSWTRNLLVDTVGIEMANNVLFLPSMGASGGILIAAAERFFTLSHPHLTQDTISAKVTMLAENKTWTITGVYGPQSDADKIQFLQELTNLQTQMLPAWLVLGDFNLILNAQEKNNARLNLPLINRFKATVDNLHLARIELRGKRYTWCNDHQTPTMTRIDHLFVSADWLELFPRTDLHALASLGSDHSALFLQGNIDLDFYRGFRFESHWIHRPGFLDTVKEARSRPVTTQDTISGSTSKCYAPTRLPKTGDANPWVAGS